MPSEIKRRIKEEIQTLHYFVGFYRSPSEAK
jgi:hypothetical protein